MIEGEDGTIFCYLNNVEEKDLNNDTEDAEKDYPCATIWAERENNHYEPSYTDSEYDNSFDEEDF